MKKKRPETKLIVEELLDGYCKTDLARIMGITYTQLYKYTGEGANPTLLMLERLASGLSELRNEEISLIGLLNINGYVYDIK